MSLVVGTNTSAQLAQDALRANQHKTATAMQRLSTGLRIYSARDDAAGLAISQSMTSQIRGLNQAVRNINDGVNLLQTAEGGLGSITDMLQRMRELAVQSANGTNSDAQRAYLQKEAAALQEQIGKIADTTTWNDKKLLDGSFTGQKIQVGAASEATMDLNIVNPIHASTMEPQKIWTKLLGTSSNDSITSMTTGNDGAIYVGGWTEGNLDGQNNASGLEAFLTKFNEDGTKAWTRVLGALGPSEANAITTAPDGSVYLSGYTGGSLNGQSNIGDKDAFVTKFNSDGTTGWTRLVGTSSEDQALAVTAGNDGSVYISGFTRGAIDGQINGGGSADAFITKFSVNGTKEWTKQLGTNGLDLVHGMTTGLDGSIYISGATYGSLDGQTFNGEGDIFLSKFKPDGSTEWTKQLGSSSSQGAETVKIGVDGSIYVSGVTLGDFDNQPFNGITDAFLTKFNPDGSQVWTRLLGTGQGEVSYGSTIGKDGSVYISGYTSGVLAGTENYANTPTPTWGINDVFLAQYSQDGTRTWTAQIGVSGNNGTAQAQTTGTDGAIYMAGYYSGNFDGVQGNGGTDGFISKYAPPSFSVDLSTQAGASSAIGVIDGTLDSVNSTRSTIGSYINRLNYAADNATNISTNLAASRSTIQDTDYAEESTNLAKSQIVEQAATAMLAQANQQPQSVLALLKNL